MNRHSSGNVFHSNEKKTIMLQFKTVAGAKTPVAEQIRKVIAGGGRWIELDATSTDAEALRKVVDEVMPLCIEKEVFLVLRGNPELAKELNVGGVRLEHRKGMLPSQARLLLGAAAIVGATGRDFDDVLAVRSLDVDFIALSPFRSAEPGAEPLGVEGLKEVTDKMKAQDITLAVVADGGIRFEDLEECILKGGANGVAVGHAIAEADDIEAETRRFVAELERLLPREKAEDGV